MVPQYKNKIFFWVGLIAIAVLYCLYYLSFMYGAFLEMSLRARHVTKFFSILAAYTAGVFCLKKYAMTWMVHTWSFVYLTTLCLLVLLGVYDWMVARTPLPIREIADNLQEFLISPILYVIIGIIGRLNVPEERV